MLCEEGTETESERKDFILSCQVFERFRVWWKIKS